MKSCPTYQVNIYVGLQVGYKIAEVAYIQFAIDLCQDYCTKVGLGVTVTPTNFVYVDGNEPGVIVGLINYPRFPSTETQIVAHAIELATILKLELKQERVSIVTPTQTYMIED